MQKKIKAIIFFVLVLCPLSASFNIGYVGEGEYFEVVKASFSTINTVSSESAIKTKVSNLNHQNNEKYGLQYSKELNNENFKTLESLKRDEVEEGPYYPIELKSIEVDKETKEFLMIGDQEATSYIKRINDLDALLVLKAQKSDSTESFTLLYDGEFLIEGLYTPMLFNEEVDRLNRELCKKLVSDDYSLVKISTVPENASIYIDNKRMESETKTFLLKKGEHHITLSTYGYLSHEENINIDEDSSFSFLLPPKESTKVFVSTTPYDATLFLNGYPVESKWIETTLPYTITLKKDGFESFSYQKEKDDNIIKLTLKPEINVDLSKEKKKEFYLTLFSSLVSFGGYCGVRALSNIYQKDIFNTLSYIATGATVISLVSLVRSAVEYYKVESGGR